VKVLALSLAAVTLSSISIFAETIDPPPLKVHQVCGQAFAANAKIEIRKEPLGEAVATAITDEPGEFSFSELPAGRLHMVMPGLAMHWYPIELSKPLAASTHKKPLFIRPMTGSESGIIVSFKRE